MHGHRRLASAVLASSVLLAACGGGGTGDAAGEGPATGRPGSLVIAYPSSPSSFDPHRDVTSIVAEAFQYGIYDRLTGLDPRTLEVVPKLATGWSFAEDGSTLDLQLRDDVTFHDGTPFDAEAVRVNIERAQSVEGTTAAALLASIRSVEVLDRYTVRLHLAEGKGAELLGTFASTVGSMISPTAIASGRDLVREPGNAGSGPYLLEEFVPDQRVVFLDAPGEHWDMEGRSLERIEVQIIPEVPAQLNALQSGQLQLVQVRAPHLAQADRLAEGGRFRVHRVDTFGQHHLVMSSTRGALTDERVRQAINHAIDRDAIAQALLEGQCTPTVQPYPEGHWAYAPDLEARFGYDPQRARDLLTQAGAVGMTFRLVYPAGQSYEPVAQAVQSMLQDVGIEVAVAPGQSTQQLRQEYIAGEHDGLQTAIVAGTDPSFTVANYFLGGITVVGAAGGDEIAQLAAGALDPTAGQDQRAEIYRRIWAEVLDGAWSVPICQVTQSWAYAPEVTGVEDMVWATQNVFDLRSLGVTG